MANIRRMYLRAEMSDGDTVELLNFTVGSDGKVQKLDESSLDTLLDTPEVAKMWGQRLLLHGRRVARFRFAL